MKSIPRRPFLYIKISCRNFFILHLFCFQIFDSDIITIHLLRPYASEVTTLWRYTNQFIIIIIIIINIIIIIILQLQSQ